MVVADARTPRDGKFIEEVGSYDPFTKECSVKSERIAYWLGVGAQPTDVVKKLLKNKIPLANKTTKKVETPQTN